MSTDLFLYKVIFLKKYFFYFLLKTSVTNVTNVTNLMKYPNTFKKPCYTTFEFVTFVTVL